MLPFYIGAFLLGGILIMASIVLGGGNDDFDKDISLDKDFDFNADADFDADIEADGAIDADLSAATGDLDGEGWLPFLSMRFWTFALACFGMSGTFMNALGTSDLISAPISAVTGIGLGWMIAYAFHRLKTDTVSSNTSTTSLVNQEGKALLPISKEQRGKVRLSLGTEILDLEAITNDPMPIERGEKIIIVSVKGGTAVISSMIPLSQKKRDAELNQTPHTHQSPNKELD
ncbi:MAG: NfeD family protein [Myxococcota bacterium]|nr:NfeD family protein [Myxococcota bacterium]